MLVKSLQCSHCKKKYRFQKNLSRHIESAHNSNFAGTQYKCLECSIIFPNRSELLQHFKLEERKKVNSEVVENQIKNMSVQIVQKRKRQLIKCPHCPSLFKQNRTLAKHLINDHKIVMSRTTRTPKPEPTPVKTLTTDKIILYTNVKDTPGYTQDRRRLKFECQRCDYKCNKKFYLHKHIRQSHSDVAIKRTKKNLANTLYINKLKRAQMRSLINIKEKEDSQLELKCSLCPAEFKTIRSLKNHSIFFHKVENILTSTTKKDELKKFQDKKQTSEEENNMSFEISPASVLNKSSQVNRFNCPEFEQTEFLGEVAIRAQHLIKFQSEIGSNILATNFQKVLAIIASKVSDIALKAFIAKSLHETFDSLLTADDDERQILARNFQEAILMELKPENNAQENNENFEEIHPDSLSISMQEDAQNFSDVENSRAYEEVDKTNSDDEVIELENNENETFINPQIIILKTKDLLQTLGSAQVVLKRIPSDHILALSKKQDLTRLKTSANVSKFSESRPLLIDIAPTQNSLEKNKKFLSSPPPSQPNSDIKVYIRRISLPASLN